MLGQTARVFPDTAISLGDEWSTTSTQQLNGKLTANADCTLTQLTDSTAKIELIAELRNKPEAKSLSTLSTVQMDLTGKQKGSLTLSRRSGIIINSSMKANLEGVAHTIQGDVPVTITTKKEIKNEILSAVIN